MASGVPALEEELVDYLLTEKRTGFLLSTCDRVTALARRLRPSSETDVLCGRICTLVNRIAEIHPVTAHPSAPPGPIEGVRFALAKSARTLMKRWGGFCVNTNMSSA